MEENIEQIEVKHNLLADKISLEEIRIALNVKDIFTAIRWCKRKDIVIIKFGKGQYINRIVFEIAVDRPFIESLKIKYPRDWKELYSAYKNRDYVAIADFTLDGPPLFRPKFVPPGPAGAAFLKELNKRSKIIGTAK